VSDKLLISDAGICSHGRERQVCGGQNGCKIRFCSGTSISPCQRQFHQCASRHLTRPYLDKVFLNPTINKFGPESDEITGEWRRLHNKELYALYSLPNIIRVVKSRRLRWAGHVARMKRVEMHAGF
jgi:hypothetical protein